MKSKERTLRLLLRYFRGERYNHLKNGLNQKYKTLKKVFFDTKISDPLIQKYIDSIIQQLNIPESTRLKIIEKNPSIYEFLITLSQEGYFQAEYIVDLVDEKTRFRKLTLFLGGSAIAGILATLIATPGFHFILEFVKYFVSFPIGMPIISLCTTLCVGVFNVYWIYQNRKNSITNRIRDNLFLFLSLAVKLAAVLLMLTTSVTMSPLIAGMYVLSSSIDAVKEIFCLVQEYFEYKNKTMPAFSENDPLIAEKDRIRRDMGYHKRWNAIAINLIAAVLMVGIIACWHFMPPTIVLTIVVVVGVSLVYALKYLWLKLCESQFRDDLQDELIKADRQQFQEQQYDLTQTAEPRPGAQTEEVRTHAFSQFKTHSRTKKNPSFFTPLADNFSPLEISPVADTANLIVADELFAKSSYSGSY